MNFSGEDRKEVFFFFEAILRHYKQPVYYENLRGHVSYAPTNVRKYVLVKCRGDNFLEYFKRRKNYFNVEDGKISLKEKFGKEQQENSHSNKSKRKNVEGGKNSLKEEFGKEQQENSLSNKSKEKNSKGKFRRRDASVSRSSHPSSLKGGDANTNGEKEYETIALSYFRNRLMVKKKESIWAIEVNDLPKKVKRHLQLYYRYKSSKNSFQTVFKSFLSEYPDKFVINSDDETVSLAHVPESTEKPNSSSVDNEASVNCNENSVNDVDSEIQKASEYLECVVFFIGILKKLNQPFPIEKLGGYFSQSRKELKEHVKINYRSFKYFFDDAPLIFLKNDSEEISLSKDYKKLVKAAENLIRQAINGLASTSDMPLKSRITYIFQPQISSRRSSSILEEGNDNNEDLLFEDIVKEKLKFNYINRSESEISHESTDEFLDNYLMRSTSRESSISLSSRSNRSVSVESSRMKNCSTIENMKISGSDIVLDFDEKEVMENTFLRCVLSVELFCLEFMESELNFIHKYENKAIEYFMEILDASSTKIWKLNSLKGSVGNDREVALFMNKLYKEEKFVLFFEKHPQFVVDPPFVKIALFDKTNSVEESASFSNENNVVKDLKDLYEISEFKILLKETYAYLYDVCEFCKSKDDVKIERVSGILPRFHSCFNMIKSSKGQSLSEKVEHFLQETMIFQFPKKGILFFPYKIFHEKCQILFTWFEKMKSYDPSLEFVSFSDFWKKHVYSKSALNSIRKGSNGYINLEECYQNVVDMIEKEIESRSELYISYHDLPKVIPENILFSLTNGDYYSRPLISALFENGNFRLKDGQISLQKTPDDNYSVSSDNKVDESTENLCVLENLTSGESSNSLYIQQNEFNDNNTVNSSCSPSITSNDFGESKIESCSNETSKILQTTECFETEETDSKSVDFKSNLSWKDDKMSIDLPLINQGQNENHISETIKESSVCVQEESERCMNVLNDNLSSDVALTDPEKINLAEETEVCIKSSKAEDLAGKENENIDESSTECFKCEDEGNSKTDSPDSDVHSLLTPPEFCEYEEHQKENQSLSSVNGNLSEQENELDNEQMPPSDDLNLDTNCIAPLKEKALDEDDLTKSNPELEVTNKNGVELNIKALKEEQNIPSISEDVKSSKLGIDLLSKQNSIDSVDAETEMTKPELYNSESPNEDTLTRISEQSTDRNRNLDNRKAPEQIEGSFQSDIPQVPDFNDKQAQQRNSVPVSDFKEIQESKGLHAISRNINVSSKHSFTYTPEELFETSLMKLYLNSDNVSEGSTPSHDLESEKQNSAIGVPFAASGKLTSPHNGKSEKSISRTSSCNDVSSEYPMQPIMAKVVLLTNSSCIALADAMKCKKNIYFLKYAFTCEHQDDCSECFSALQIGDEVSCFVPLNEISQKIWIAFMVTKDNSDNLSECGIFDKLQESAKAICKGSTKSFISAQIKNSAHHMGCQTEFPKCDHYSQTDLNNDVGSYKATKETCQTRSVSVKSVFVQTENLTRSSHTQCDSKNEEIPLCRNCARCQMYLNGDCENGGMSENAAYWDNWHRETGLTKNVSCQTFSTGEIIMLNHHLV